MKINVLGTDYEVVMYAKEKEYPKLQYGDGYCDFTTKQIVIAEVDPEGDTVDDLDSYYRRIIRHELVHAFMYESGIDSCTEWGQDESLVDWIAIQSPKMMKLFEELEVKQS